MKKMETKQKIQAFEKDLRQYNVFKNEDIYKTFFELNIENEDLREFIDTQYKDYTFNFIFEKEYQRNDLDYVEDQFIGIFKTPITLRKKIVNFMNKNNINILPYEKNVLSLYCEGKVELNGLVRSIRKVLTFFRELNRERIPCRVTFIPPSNKKMFDVLHINFKKYYFQKKLPIRMKQEEIDEFTKLIDKSYSSQLSQKESLRMNELKKKEDEQRFGRIQYIYRIKNNEPRVIDKLWKLSDLEKLLNGLNHSLSSKIRSYITMQQKYKTGKFKGQKQIDGIVKYFSSIKDFIEKSISEDIVQIRETIKNCEDIDNDKIDGVINNICNFTLSLKDLFFMDIDDYLKKRSYTFSQ